MTRFMMKVNAEHCPRALSWPSTAADWEGGTFEVPKAGPRRIEAPDRRGLPAVEQGDEIWICTDNAGRGLTAKAIVAASSSGGRGLRITVREVELLEHPVGLSEFGRLASGSRMISRLQASRHPDLYVFDDQAFEEFANVTTRHTDSRSRSSGRL